jgi:pimeloyl-ACP methyl ester carboxylesterase
VSTTPAARRVSLVAVHGNGGGAFRFSLAAPHFPADVDFSAITLPGFGGLERDTTLTTLSDYADRVAEMVADVPRPRVLLGHGIGASMLLDLTGRRPEICDGVILHAPVGPLLGRRIFPLAMRVPGARRGLQRMIATRALRPVWRRMLFGGNVPREFSAQFLSDYGRCPAFGQMFDVITPSWFLGLETVRVPTVLLWGGRDRVLRANHSVMVRPLLADGRVEIVPEWNHFPMVEQPAQYAAHTARIAVELSGGSRV